MSETVLLDIVFDSDTNISHVKYHCTPISPMSNKSIYSNSRHDGTQYTSYEWRNNRYNNVLEPGVNLLQVLKKFRVIRDDFATLSELLFQLQQKSNYSNSDAFYSANISYQLTDRNGVFTNTYLLTGIDTPILLAGPLQFKIIEPGYLKIFVNVLLSSGKSLSNTNKLDYIRHELLNPLHTIKMTNDLMKTNNRSGQLATDKCNYNAIIDKQINDSMKLLDEILYSSAAQLDKMYLSSFINFIGNYIQEINTTYTKNIQPIIICPFDIQQSATLSINTCYLKIILDNVFKNIFGHLAEYIKPKNQFMDFTLQFGPGNNGEPNIFIYIRNIMNSKPVKLTAPKSYFHKKIMDIYHLDSQTKHNTCINTFDVNGNSNSNANINKIAIFSETNTPNTYSDTSAKLSTGTGIKLINELCQKMNICWSLNESIDNIATFELAIPIINNEYIKPINKYSQHSNFQVNSLAVKQSC